MKPNLSFKQVNKIWKKHQRQWQTPNYYGRNRSQFLTSIRKIFRIKTYISSKRETARRSSAYNKRREKRIFYSNRSRKYEKSQLTPNHYPNYYGSSQSPILNPRSESWRIKTTISSRKKTQGGAPLTIREGKMNYLFKQDQKMWKNLANPRSLIKLLRMLLKSILDPRNRKFAQ